jgi:uncharacterized membrane protein
VGWGSTLLFLTNLTGIIFSGILIFLWQEYGSLQRAKQGILASVVMMLLLGLPLGLSLRNLLIQSNLRQQVRQLVRHELPLFAQEEITSIQVRQQDQGLNINLEVLAVGLTLTPTDLATSQQFLETALGQPITLTVRVIPIQEYSTPAVP